MRFSATLGAAILAVLICGVTAPADQIILRDGTAYSGTFVRGDARTVDFRVLGRTENFQISDIAQIVFSEPEPEVAEAPPAWDQPETYPPEPEPVRQAAQTIPPEEEIAPAGGTDSSVTLPAGTPVLVRTTTAIDTDRNRVGDVFDAILEEPLAQDGYIVAQRGARLKGRIAYAKESGKLTGQSQLLLELTELIANGKRYYLRTTDYVEEGSSRGKRTAQTVGGVAALGAVIGAIAGGGKGAAIGAAAGAGAGTGVQVLTRGEVLKIPAETVLEFKLQTPMTVSVP
ncbi:MAG: hypothetical protein JW793_12300 [Acidobacteria bacterium]|nr:hypothetical protein [Acidobacteriota bacterium]